MSCLGSDGSGFREQACVKKGVKKRGIFRNEFLNEIILRIIIWYLWEGTGTAVRGVDTVDIQNNIFLFHDNTQLCTEKRQTEIIKREKKQENEGNEKDGRNEQKLLE